MEQLEEVQQSLARLATGDMGLVDSVGAMQLAIQVTGLEYTMHRFGDNVIYCRPQYLMRSKLLRF